MTATETTNVDEYNGWTNRETWAASLHLSNDFGLYEMVNGWANDARREAVAFGQVDTDMLERVGWTVESGTVGRLADMLKDYFEGLRTDIIDATGPLGAEILPTREGVMMLLEVGSLWRVDWRELASNWLEGFEFEGDVSER